MRHEKISRLLATVRRLETQHGERLGGEQASSLLAEARDAVGAEGLALGESSRLIACDGDAPSDPLLFAVTSRAADLFAPPWGSLEVEGQEAVWVRISHARFLVATGPIDDIEELTMRVDLLAFLGARLGNDAVAGPLTSSTALESAGA